MQKCPCHSNLPYTQCCKKLHQGSLPSDALSVMRARYCAYALGLVDYIIHTTHVDNSIYSRDLASWKKSLKQFCSQTQFSNLEIVHFEQQGNLAYVSFIASLQQKNEVFALIEKSTFKKEGNRWLYLAASIYSSKESLIKS